MAIIEPGFEDELGVYKLVEKDYILTKNFLKGFLASSNLHVYEKEFKEKQISIIPVNEVREFEKLYQYKPKITKNTSKVYMVNISNPPMNTPTDEFYSKVFINGRLLDIYTEFNFFNGNIIFTFADDDIHEKLKELNEVSSIIISFEYHVFNNEDTLLGDVLTIDYFEEDGTMVPTDDMNANERDFIFLLDNLNPNLIQDMTYVIDGEEISFLNEANLIKVVEDYEYLIIKFKDHIIKFYEDIKIIFNDKLDIKRGHKNFLIELTFLGSTDLYIDGFHLVEDSDYTVYTREDNSRYIDLSKIRSTYFKKLRSGSKVICVSYPKLPNVESMDVFSTTEYKVLSDMKKFIPDLYSTKNEMKFSKDGIVTFGEFIVPLDNDHLTLYVDGLRVANTNIKNLFEEVDYVKTLKDLPTNINLEFINRVIIDPYEQYQTMYFQSEYFNFVFPSYIYFTDILNHYIALEEMLTIIKDYYTNENSQPFLWEVGDGHEFSRYRRFARDPFRVSTNDDRDPEEVNDELMFSGKLVQPLNSNGDEIYANGLKEGRDFHLIEFYDNIRSVFKQYDEIVFNVNVVNEYYMYRLFFITEIIDDYTIKVIEPGYIHDDDLSRYPSVSGYPVNIVQGNFYPKGTKFIKDKYKHGLSDELYTLEYKFKSLKDTILQRREFYYHNELYLNYLIDLYRYIDMYLSYVKLPYTDNYYDEYRKRHYEPTEEFKENLRDLKNSEKKSILRYFKSPGYKAYLASIEDNITYQENDEIYKDERNLKEYLNSPLADDWDKFTKSNLYKNSIYDIQHKEFLKDDSVYNAIPRVSAYFDNLYRLSNEISNTGKEFYYCRYNLNAIEEILDRNLETYELSLNVNEVKEFSPHLNINEDRSVNLLLKYYDKLPKEKTIYNLSTINRSLFNLGKSLKGVLNNNNIQTVALRDLDELYKIDPTLIHDLLDGNPLDAITLFNIWSNYLDRPSYDIVDSFKSYFVFEDFNLYYAMNKRLTSGQNLPPLLFKKSLKLNTEFTEDFVTSIDSRYSSQPIFGLYGLEQCLNLESLILIKQPVMPYKGYWTELSRLKKLKTLILTGCYRIDDLRWINKASSPQTIIINGTSISNLYGLNFTDTKHLNISDTEVDDIGLLSSAIKLEHLELINTNVTEFPSNIPLENLKTLRIGSNTWIDDLEFPALSNLELLELRNVTIYSYFFEEMICNCENLKYLIIDNCNFAFNNEVQLSKLKNLKVLKITNSNLDNFSLEPGYQPSGVLAVILDSNNLTEINRSLWHFIELPNLRILSLVNNKISDINFERYLNFRKNLRPTNKRIIDLRNNEFSIEVQREYKNLQLANTKYLDEILIDLDLGFDVINYTNEIITQL